MINIGARLTGSVEDFSGRRKRADVASGRPGGFIVTNGRGTKICLIKTRRGQHSRALLYSAYGRGINLPPPLLASLVRNLTLIHRARPRVSVFLFRQKEGGNEREITRLDLFVCSFPSYRLKYLSTSLSFPSTPSTPLSLYLSLPFVSRERSGFTYFVNSECSSLA